LLISPQRNGAIAAVKKRRNVLVKFSGTIAFLWLVNYMKDPPKSPFLRGTFQVPPLRRGARGDPIEVDERSP
jgi:hypothetical protein